MARFRTFEPRPSKALIWAYRGWLALALGYCLANVWLPIVWAQGAGQGLWLVGLFLALSMLLTALAARSVGLAVRGAVIVVLGFFALGPQEGAPVVSAGLRLLSNQGVYEEALAAHALGAPVRCDCLFTDAAGAPVAAFRWRRGFGAWDGIAHDPGRVLSAAPIRRLRDRAANSGDQAGPGEEGGTPAASEAPASPLGGALLAVRPVYGPWVYVVVARDRQPAGGAVKP
ncbi:hypothetical protein CCR85_10690 [Rhodothalassium salexigens]|uniref:hypothetical protein n=1 Tax=Rhodothalassium salexigens TaxID=1086 RepID=UPI001911EFBF|nr:hypothetical protein [Rhodothalassium salexigens]MBK5911956.1 hypothetical protein [Rhodothalassium salexigens]MBK5922120.1 hypothetical protein [Rhodothalassium salexigens]